MLAFWLLGSAAAFLVINNLTQRGRHAVAKDTLKSFYGGPSETDIRGMGLRDRSTAPPNPADIYTPYVGHGYIPHNEGDKSSHLTRGTRSHIQRNHMFYNPIHRLPFNNDDGTRLAIYNRDIAKHETIDEYSKEAHPYQNGLTEQDEGFATNSGGLLRRQTFHAVKHHEFMKSDGQFAARAPSVEYNSLNGFTKMKVT